MNTRACYSAALAVISMILVVTNIAYAACDGAAVQSESYCLYHPDISTIGGDSQGDSHALVASNMYPYQQQSTESDLEYWYNVAIADLAAGKAYRQDLLLIDAVPNDGTPLGDMLADPKLNYETAGLLASLANIEARLLSARDTFAFDVFKAYPDAATAQEKLLDTIKTLTNIYLMIADEFLIDALEYRFSSDTLGLDSKLNEQIDLLSNAQIYYEKALDGFVSGFSPGLGTNIYVADYFDDAVFSLFNLSVERLSLALREKSSKQLVRQMAPDPDQGWEAARAEALQTLKSVNIAAYLATAAIAETQGNSFDAVGSDSSLVGALTALRRQGNIYNQRLNPLGYDNRYVPMDDVEDLYNIASQWLGAAQAAENTFASETRDFDANEAALRSERSALTNQYATSLASLTGCPFPDPPDDPESSEVEDFLICAGEAGGDLFDCRLELGPDAFEACVSASQTGGVLASKYRDIMAAQLRLNAAKLSKENILKRIELENERNDRLIEIKRSAAGAQAAKLDEYYEKLKKARRIVDTVTITSARERVNGDWGIKKKTRDHTTTTTFSIDDEDLQLNTEQEKELLEITTDYEIRQANLQTAFVIKDLLLSEAEAEIEIELAVQQKNSAIADFDNTFKEKENLWYLYQRALDQLGYYTDKVATLRILKSQAAIDLSEKLNYTAHYAYLAAKALEYKYLTPLVDEPVPGGRLRITDLFKAQTPSDMEELMIKLNAFNTQKCPWGTFDPQYYTISLAYHILGLTNGYLDPDGDGYTQDGKTVAKARRERVQAFINENINGAGRLQFAFTISEDASFLANSGLYNLKIWSGSSPSPCDPLVTPVIGTSISVITTQAGNIRPKVHLQQVGHSSLRDAFGDILEYIPVNDLHFLLEGGGAYIPFKEAEFLPFINQSDPRQGGSGGTWTGAFKGRSISSSDWELELFDWNVIYDTTDLSKITDILVHIDTIGECCY